MDQLIKKIRKSDYERFFCTLFAPEKYRNALFTLYAFNFEIAKIREVTTEPLIGMIRLQWWREAIDEIYAGKPRRHEVIDHLAPIIKKYHLSQELFFKIIDGREKDLDQYPIETTADLQDYTEKTSSSLLLLAIEILGCENSETEEFLNCLGRSWAICGLLRSLKFHYAKNRCYLPRKLLKEHKINIEQLEKDQEKLTAILKIIANMANEQLKKSQEVFMSFDKKTKKILKPISLLVIFARSYLQRMEKVNYRLLSHDIEEPKLPILMKVIWASFF